MAAVGAPGSETARGRWRMAIAVLATALLLCWPAFYNGYPLVYDDSASYLDSINPKAMNWARPIFYTAFLRPFHLHLWLWPAIFVQSLILAHLIYVTMRALCGRITPETYLLLMFVPAATTMLPWLTSIIMPHAFTGVVVLGLFLLGFAQDRLGPREKWYIALLTACAITFHMSHLGLALGLLAVILAVGAVLHGKLLRPRRAALLAFPVVAAMGAQLAVNSYAFGTVSLAPASSIFLLARFVADGPAVDYLRDTCPRRKFILCDYLDRLPNDSDEFLWPRDGVFRRAGGAPALRDEAREIVAGTLRAYPGQVLANTVRHMARQMVDLRIDSIMPGNPFAVQDNPIRTYIQGFFPGAYGDYLASRQSTDRLPLRAIDIVHGLVTAISFAVGLFVMIAFARRGNTLMVALPLVIVAAWIGNAAIVAGVSGVFGHYQGRLGWVVTLYATLGVLCLAREGLRGPAVFAPQAQTQRG